MPSDSQGIRAWLLSLFNRRGVKDSSFSVAVTVDCNSGTATSRQAATLSQLLEKSCMRSA